MTPPPDSPATPALKKKQRKRSKGQAGSSLLVATGTPEYEQKRKKVCLTEEEENKDHENKDGIEEEERCRDGQLDKNAVNVTAKKKKKRKRDKPDVEEMGEEQKKKKKKTDRETWKVEMKSEDKPAEKQTEGESGSQEGVMDEEDTKECLTETRAETVASPETDLRDQLLDELEEFVPDVRNRSKENISKLIKYDLQRFRSFRQQGKPSPPALPAAARLPPPPLHPLTCTASTGVALRWGRCSEEENLQIRQNVQDFLSLTGIGSADQLLFPHRYKEQEEEIKQLKKRHHFLTRIGTPLPVVGTSSVFVWSLFWERGTRVMIGQG